MRSRKLWLLLASAIVVVAVVAGVSLYRETSDVPAPASESDSPTVTSAATTEPIETERQGDIERSYAGSASCERCHSDHYLLWKNSHHGLAERKIDPALDREAFVPAREIGHGSLESVCREMDGKFEIVTTGADGKVAPFVPTEVIGVAPLYQFVIPAERGRLQVAALSYDPKLKEWFDVYGEEDRRPDEWGFWANRGMTWNTMCAFCHMTNLKKNYDVATDSYTTSWSEMAVGCEACHGPYAEHVAWYDEHPDERWPHRPIRTPDKTLNTCGSCHARRTELTDGYIAGELFTDHYRPALPDQTPTYYPDGQVREEDYEYVSFLSSRMYTEGVRCFHCHEPHSAKLRLVGNAMCLSCHREKIDPVTHSRHDVSGPGGQCANCHMPLTTYMQRHPRRDHGFTIPDPLLTKELEIPNACNRCHDDKTVDWAIEATENWYGERMQRGTRQRTRTVAHGQRGDPQAIPGLLAMVQNEKSPVWRTVGVNLLRSWLAIEVVQNAFSKWLADPEPLVRAAAVNGLGFFPDGDRRVRHLMGDISRLVRIEAAWANRRNLDVSRGAGKELMNYLDVVADQPTGALQRGMFYLDRGDLKRAEKWMDKAIHWDPNSAPLYHARAVVLSSTRRLTRAIKDLQKARDLEPNNPEFPYAQGLAYAELGKLDLTILALDHACSLDPQFGRAWYNLGLAYIQTDDVHQGLAALANAENAEPGNPEYPYVRATVHIKRGEFSAAREAAEKALEIAPNYEPAQHLLDAAKNPPPR